MTTENSSDAEPSIKNQNVLIKFGGNAMTDPEILNNVIDNICQLQDMGANVILVHGGGPYINEILEMANLESEFISGQRKTTEEVINYVEMALKGNVNGKLVSKINSKDKLAVGISGKDAKTVLSKKRFHYTDDNTKVDLGQVGEVVEVNTKLIDALLKENLIPVIAPLSYGIDDMDYNVNADNFAGKLAAAIGADHFIILSNVDGLLEDKDNPDTLIKFIDTEKAKTLFGTVIQGGMIPKIESCLDAIENGVSKVHMLNSKYKDIILQRINEDESRGTTISKTKKEN